MSSIPFAVVIDCIGTTAKIGVISLSNSDVTILVNGNPPDETNPLTMNNIGGGGNTLVDGLVTGDSSAAGTIPAAYYVVGTFSGLVENSKYSASVTQDGVTNSDISFRTDPGTADHSVFVITCDGRTNGATPKGCYSYIRNYMETSTIPVAAIMHVDDHGYGNNMHIDSTQPAESAAVTKHIYCNKPDTDKNLYSHTLTYCAYLGLLETDDVAPATQNQGSYLPYFHDPDRIWVRHHAVYKRAVGDHEWTNNPGEVVISNSLWRGSATNAWLNTMACAMTHLDTGNSLAWSNTVGPVQYMAFDRWRKDPVDQKQFDITTQEPQGGGYDGGYKLLGDPQILDLQGSYDSTSPFKIFLMASGSKFMMSKADRLAAVNGTDWTGDTWVTQSLGAQEPIGGYTNSNTDGESGENEWDVLMRIKPDATYTDGGLCYQAGQNGDVIFGVHGDTHRQYEYYHYFAEDATHSEMDFLECSCGTVNGENFQLLHYNILNTYLGNTVYSYNGVHAQWFPPYLYDGSSGMSTCIRLDVFPTQNKITINYLGVPDSVTDSTKAVVLRKVDVVAGQSCLADKRIRKGFI